MNGIVLDNVALLMTRTDTVATTLDDLESGHSITVDGKSITLTTDIPFGHKVALTDMAAGDDVRKYGEVIGCTTHPIEPGEWVHTHNCESTRGRGDLASMEDTK